MVKNKTWRAAVALEGGGYVTGTVRAKTEFAAAEEAVDFAFFHVPSLEMREIYFKTPEGWKTTDSVIHHLQFKRDKNKTWEVAGYTEYGRDWTELVRSRTARRAVRKVLKKHFRERDPLWWRAGIFVCGHECWYPSEYILHKKTPLRRRQRLAAEMKEKVRRRPW